MNRECTEAERRLVEVMVDHTTSYKARVEAMRDVRLERLDPAVRERAVKAYVDYELAKKHVSEVFGEMKEAGLITSAGRDDELVKALEDEAYAKAGGQPL